MSGKTHMQRPSRRGAPAPAGMKMPRRALGEWRSVARARNSHERQADDAAARILRGDSGVARLLSPIAAASFRAPTSPGEPLAPALRRELEPAFGADLAAVRIHRDAPAEAAARQAGAAAFASGRDVYFDGGRFNPAQPEGRRLLLHEITHVLQQTGRRDSRGQLRATDIEGMGQVQRKDEFVDLADQFKLFAGSFLGWTGIKEAYKDVPDVATHSARIEQILPPTMPVSAEEIAGLVALTKLDDFKGLSPQLKGLYVDALKMAGGYDRAAEILIAAPSIPTAFRYRPLYESARQQSLTWISGLAASNSFAKSYYPDRLVAVYGAFFLSPGVAPLDLDPDASKADAKSFHTKILDELAALKAETGLMDNELRAAMLLALYYLDDGRPAKLTGDLKALRGDRKSLVEGHRDLAQAYATHTSDDLSPSPSRESTALFTAVLKPIQDAATKAAKFWNRSIAFLLAQRGGQGFEDLDAAEVKAIADAIKSDPRFKRFPDVLRDTGKQLFERPGGQLLGQPAFAAKIAQRQAALRAEMATYLSRVLELVRSDKDAEAEGLRLGLALAYLAEVEQVLAQYDRGRDAELTKNGRTDERIACRVRLARALLPIAIRFDWDNLRDVANSVFQEGLQIALLGSWEPDLTADFSTLGQMKAELAGQPGTKISGALLGRFAYVKYFDYLAGELTTLLNQRQGDFTDTTPILTEAVKNAKQNVRYPRRFIVKNWEVGDPSMAKVKGGAGFVSPAVWSKGLRSNLDWSTAGSRKEARRPRACSGRSVRACLWSAVALAHSPLRRVHQADQRTRPRQAGA